MLRNVALVSLHALYKRIMESNRRCFYIAKHQRNFELAPPEKQYRHAYDSSQSLSSRLNLSPEGTQINVKSVCLSH